MGTGSVQLYAPCGVGKGPAVGTVSCAMIESAGARGSAVADGVAVGVAVGTAVGAVVGGSVSKGRSSAGAATEPRMPVPAGDLTGSDVEVAVANEVAVAVAVIVVIPAMGRSRETGVSPARAEARGSPPSSAATSTTMTNRAPNRATVSGPKRLWRPLPPRLLAITPGE